MDDTEHQMFEDMTYSDGVLNIYMIDKKTFVLNKQTPNMQIWLSSPISGPQRFEFKEQIN